MFDAMVTAVKSANKLITLGWKGADEHFTKLLESENDGIDGVTVVSPSGDTNLVTVFDSEIIDKIESKFSYFVGESDGLVNLLKSYIPG
jgi:hypothetical protein